MTFDALFVPAELREAVSDRAWLEAMFEVERALANAEALAGAIPAHVAGPIAEACDVDRFDVEAIVEEGRAAGNPAEPLVRALRAAVGGEAANYVHFGATSQDIVDSAAMLVARRALGLIEEDLRDVEAACAGLAEEHRLTPMAARTLLQQAVPTTFGLKAAGWLVAAVRARLRLVELRHNLAAQLGGAAGTLAALGEDGPAVAAQFAAELGLVRLLLPWHTDRTDLAELGASLAVAAGVCAKAGYDVALLEQTEVGEVRERSGGGGSSTMPHKRNPVGSALAVACARRVEASASVLLGALASEHERGLGVWQSEWGALSDALAYTGGAAAAIGGVLHDLEVDSGRMLANLEAGGGGVMSERIVFELAEKSTGYQRARETVSTAAHRAAESGRPLRDELAGQFSSDELDELFDPAGYLGSAGSFVDAALAFHREHLR
jgi:3-carboxy-cis,cis-muconate cycloisomerase